MFALPDGEHLPRTQQEMIELLREMLNNPQLPMPPLEGPLTELAAAAAAGRDNASR